MNDIELIRKIKKEEIEKYEYIAINEVIADEGGETIIHPICFVASELLNGNIEIRKIDLENSNNSGVTTGIAICINERIGVYAPTLHIPDGITTIAVGEILEIRIM